MNNPAPQSDEPLIPAAQPGGIEDAIMDGTPNQIQIDQDFSDKVNNAIDPQGNSVSGEPQEVATSEPNSDKYEPAKEFTDFLNKEIAVSEQRAPSPEPQKAAPTKEEQEDGDTRIQQLQETVNHLASMVSNDRDMVMDHQAFESVNDVYMDVTKEVSDEARPLTDFYNNAFLRDHNLKDIDRPTMEGSNKAITAELDNYFNARAQREGYVRQNGVPPSMKSNLGELTPPPKADTQDYGDPRNKPVGAFAEEDARFSKLVNNLFQQ